MAEYEWSVSKLAEGFNLDRRTVTKRLKSAGIECVRKDGRAELYELSVAARALFEPNVTAQVNELQNPEVMLPKDRKDWFQSENERLKFELAEGQLCEVDDVARQMALMAKAVVQVLETLPDVLERDCGLQPKQVARVQSSIDDLRDQLAVQAATLDE